jgi:O-antigen ligase
MSAHAPAVRPAIAAERPVLRAAASGRMWHLYLVATVVLIPFVASIGPGQIAIADVFNVIAVAAFAIVFLARRPAVIVPFLIPVFVISAASLLAITNASSPSQSMFTIAQDAYLFLWFVMLVNVMGAHDDLRAIRVAWMWVSAAIAIYGVVALMSHGYGFSELFSPKGERASATFGNANIFSDYLVLSLFVVASLSGEVRRLWRWPAIGAILLGIMASKSLGGILSLVVGLGTWFIVRAVTRRTSKLTLVAAVLVVSGLGALGVWAVKGVGVGERGLDVAASQTVAGRFGKSSESRLRIWGQLRERYAQSPLGIGPGNSKFLQLSIATRERAESYYGKEAHNDYVGYAVERGPFALIALLVIIWAAVRRPWQAWSSAPGSRWREGIAGTWTAALIAGIAASSAHSFTVEKLHFRHFWFFLALLCALSVRMGRGESVPHEPAPRSVRRS